MQNRILLKQIAIDALFIALLAIFSFVPYIGFIQVGPISFTTIHIIVLVGAAFFGWKRGLLYGFFFGIFSLFKAIQYPNSVDYFFLNPFISVLPRMLFGLISGVIFDLIKKKNSFKLFIGLLIPLSAVLTFLHTFLTLSCFYVFGVLDIFKITSILGLKELMDAFLNSYPSFWGFILAMVTFGAVCEMIVATIIVPSIYLMINKIYHINSFENNQENIKKGVENGL